MGYFCPLATPYPEPCPNGTWSNETGLMEVGECRGCTPGFYCDGFALIEPTGPCREGYYCPLASDHETEVRVNVMNRLCKIVNTGTFLVFLMLCCACRALLEIQFCEYCVALFSCTSVVHTGFIILYDFEFTDC